MKTRDKILQNQAARHLNKLLDEFGISYLDCGYYCKGICPIHEGDNPSAFNIYKESSDPRYADGGWICNTHHCEKKYGYDLLGFVQAILSKQTDKKISRPIARLYLCKFCNIEHYNDIHIPDEKVLYKQYMNDTLLSLNSDKSQAKIGSKFYGLQGLIIPAEYYIKRGYSSDILLKYGVGYNQYNQCIDVPIYDNKGKVIVGKTSRSIYEECPKCHCYHNYNESCPLQKEKYTKWRHYGIAKSRFLYNFWFAKDSMTKTNKVILVESPGNIWRLVEAGIDNCVACLGSNLSDFQEILLSSCGVLYIYILADNDEAGQNFTKKISENLKKRYNIIRLHLDSSYNDVAEAPISYIQEKILTQL